MRYDFRTREAEAQPTLSIRTRVDPEHAADRLTALLFEIQNVIEQRGLEPSGPPFVRYHDRESAEWDVEVGLPVSKPIDVEGRVANNELPGGLQAYTVHEGPCETLQDAHDELYTWLHEDGHVPSGAPWEVYHEIESQSDAPCPRRTEVVWPVR
jgi:effector-binding domain-containing protein